MKKLMFILSAALAFLTTSCIEHHAKISLNKDGSGTITEETVFGAQAVAMLEQMSAMGGEQGTDPLKDMADEAKAKEKAAKMGEGVTLEKVEAIDENGRKGARIVYAFKDINTLKYRFGESMTDVGEGMNPDAAQEKDEPIDFSFADGVLTFKNKNTAKKADEAEAGEDEEISDQELAMAGQMFSDMKMSLKLECPGGIEECTASHVDGNTVTFMEIEFGKLVSDPEKFKQFARSKPETPAEMQAALEGIEGAKVEGKDEVTIKLK